MWVAVHGEIRQIADRAARPRSTPIFARAAYRRTTWATSTSIRCGACSVSLMSWTVRSTASAAAVRSNTSTIAEASTTITLDRDIRGLSRPARPTSVTGGRLRQPGAHLFECRLLGDFSDLIEQVIRQRHAGEGGERLQPAMQIVRHIADLDHLRHVRRLLHVVHMSTKMRMARWFGSRYAQPCPAWACGIMCGAANPCQVPAALPYCADAAPTDRPRFHGRAGAAGPPLRSSRVRGRRRLPRAQIAARTRPLPLVLPRTRARLQSRLELLSGHERQRDRGGDPARHGMAAAELEAWRAAWSRPPHP